MTQLMLSDEQLDHLVDQLYRHPHGTGWLMRLATQRAVALAAVGLIALVAYVWNSNNRLTTTEINVQSLKESVADVKTDVGSVKQTVSEVKQTADATHREVQDVKRDVQNLSSRLATTRPGFTTPAAESEGKKD